MSLFGRYFLLLITLVTTVPIVNAQSTDSTERLIRVLQAKGVVTDSEARAITTNASPAEQRDHLAVLLRDKGVISTSELEAVRTTASFLQTTFALQHGWRDYRARAFVRAEVFCRVPWIA